MNDSVEEKLERFGLFNRAGETSFFATVGEAVGTHLDAHPVEWTGSEKRG